MNKKIIIIGPAHPLRGGLASFNERLCETFIKNGYNASIYSFSLQYPGFLFPGETQYTTEPHLKKSYIHSIINSINPINWWIVGKKIQKEKADILIVRYWIPFMAPCLGTILRFVKKNKHTKIICIADNILPHESRIGDSLLTKYFIKTIDQFITMSEKVQNDLKTYFNLDSTKVEHPLYDNYGEKIDKSIARKNLGLETQEKIILFFGFIRAYKGLDLLLEAMTKENIKKQNIKLLIAGEFYEKKEPFINYIQTHFLKDNVILHTHFIPNESVKNYLCACDFIIQPYKSATQSGVTPLALHFEKASLVTNVGGLPDFVEHEKAGIVCEPNSESIANGIVRLYDFGEEYFLPFLQNEKKKYTWQDLLEKIVLISKKMNKQ